MSVGDVDITKRGDIDQLKPNAVGLYSILFLCVTGSAPLAVFIYNTPFTMPYGSGSNGPATFVFATIILTIFSIAYAEMAKKVRAAGGMYTYVSHGLGQSFGLMAGYSLMIGYAIFGVALLGGFSSFAQQKLGQYGWHPNWLWLALIGVILVVCLAYFDVEISARVLGVALISEILIIGISSIFFFVHAHNVAIGPVLPWNGLNSGVARGCGVLRLLVVGRLRGRAELRRGGQGPGQGHPGRADLLVRRRRRPLHDHVVGARLGLRHGHGLVEGRERRQHRGDQRQDRSGRLQQLRARARLGRGG